jgi:hypothetical protein
MAFFGLAGLAGEKAELAPPITLAVALVAGAAAVFVLHKIMQTLARLRADGTVRIDRAVGQPGTVYLRVPGSSHGLGKVTVKLQGRLMEFNAQTAGEPLPTGATVTVVRVINSDTVEVAAAETMQGVQHA